jgi:PhnB protein
MSVKPIPEGYHTVTPYLILKDTAQAIDFYRNAFGAAETVRLNNPDGSIMHAEIRIGNSHIMLSDEYPDMGYVGPLSLGGTPVTLVMYVEDVDSIFQQAVAAGAEVVSPVKNEFYGDRSGSVKDPFGYIWSIATHVEDVSEEEMARRYAEISKQGGESN